MKSKPITFPLFFALILIASMFALFESVPIVKAQTISEVGQSTSYFATLYHQPRTFIAKGRYWVFYGNGSAFVYKTSIDGVNWSQPIVVDVTNYWYYIGLYFNGSHFFISAFYGTPRYFWCGIPNSDGSITWITQKQSISLSGFVSTIVSYIIVDSQGYPWISFTGTTDGTNYYPYVIKSDWNNGSWHTQQGFPVPLSTTPAAYSTCLVGMKNGRVYVVYAYDSAPNVKGRLWNGTAFSSEESVTQNTIYSGISYSMVADSNDVIYFVYTVKDTYDVRFVKRTNQWGNESLIVQGMYKPFPQLCLDETFGKLYCLYASSNQYIYWQVSNDMGNTWSSPNIWITDSLSGNSPFRTSRQAFDRKIPTVYLTGSSSPYKVKFAIFSLSIYPPNAPVLQQPEDNIYVRYNDIVTFSWIFSDNDTGDSQSAYRLQIGSEDFSTIVLDTGKVSTSVTSVKITIPSTEGIYHWRVKVWDSADKESPWSQSRIIRIQPIGVTPNAFCLTIKVLYFGSPVEGAKVKIGSPLNLELQTGSDGTLTLYVPSGFYHVLVWYKQITAEKSLTVVSSATLTFELSEFEPHPSPTPKPSSPFLDTNKLRIVIVLALLVTVVVIISIPSKKSSTNDYWKKIWKVSSSVFVLFIGGGLCWKKTVVEDT